MPEPGTGNNPPLTPIERQIATGLRAVWKWQRREILRRSTLVGPRKVADPELGLEFVEAWEKIVKATHRAIKQEFKNGAVEGLRQINMELFPWVHNERVDEIIRREVMKFAKQVDSTLHDTLRKTLADGLQAGDNVAQLTAKINELYEGWDKYKSKVIARTESIRALNKGKVESWKQSKVVVAKTWDSAGDACVFCLDMHGTIVELNENFLNENDVQSVAAPGGGELNLRASYGAVSGPPLHPNCRCTLTAVTTED